MKTRWVFDIKRDGKENVSRYKERLVAKGFSEIPGIDFEEVFSPVPKYATIRLILSLSVLLGKKRGLIDVKNIFVNAPLKVKNYIDQPEGFGNAGREDHVCFLKQHFMAYLSPHESGIDPP